MNRGLAREIVEFLRVSGPPEESLSRLSSFGPRAWERMLPWLHRSGLSLYLWQRLKDLQAELVLPPDLRDRLDRNLAENRCRVSRMGEEFELLNRRFEEVGVKYAVLKGFASIPDYCPNPSRRTQADYDYLLDSTSLARADKILTSLGYVRRKQRDGDHVEYFQPGRPRAFTSNLEIIYSVGLPREVDLHLQLWDLEVEKISLVPPDDALTRARRRIWQGHSFAALADDDALIFQVLHILRHILRCDCRLCTLLEIAHFVQQHSSETLFWEAFRGRLHARPWLAEAAGVVFSLARDLFGAEPPAAIEARTIQKLTPAMSLWVARYGRKLALESFSRNKFSLFLHREFIQDPAAWQEVRRRRLFLLSRPKPVEQAASPAFVARLAASGRQSVYVIRRLGFHLRGSLSYLLEYPRWRRALRHELAHRPVRNREIQLPEPGVTPEPQATHKHKA